jgi:hypothetical protein
MTWLRQVLDYSVLVLKIGALWSFKPRLDDVLARKIATFTNRSLSDAHHQSM